MPGMKRGRTILSMVRAAGRKPRARTCGWLLPPVGSVGKAGITSAKRPSGASRLIVWKMAYCLHLPTAPEPSVTLARVTARRCNPLLAGLFPRGVYISHRLTCPFPIYSSANRPIERYEFYLRAASTNDNWKEVYGSP